MHKEEDINEKYNNKKFPEIVVYSDSQYLKIIYNFSEKKKFFVLIQKL